ncbi:hypothetical protein BB558_006682 [Smittium angustum]|nr:hypothetical protein BB558_006682 [Smittium angustum]
MRRFEMPCLICPDEYPSWDPSTEDVKVVILNGRGKETPQMESWNPFNPLILKTSSGNNTVGLEFFNNRDNFSEILNFIYYSLFDTLLNSYSNEYFLIVEDDVLLTDIEQLKRDVGCVLATKTDVFSVFNSKSSDFVFIWGTQAIIYKRSFLTKFKKHLIKHLSFFPIDLLLASYHLTCKTSKEYILHKGVRHITNKD